VNYPSKTEITVAWGEMDAFGHVNNVVFFRYFESARIEYFRMIMGDNIATDDFTPILANSECAYLRPVYFPDKLVAEAAVTRLGRSSMDMEYRLTSVKQGQVVAQGKAVIVNVDRKTGKGSPLPDELRQKIADLQGQS